MSDKSTFESIRHVKGQSEYWLARELAPVLDYQRWENFEKVIDKAKNSCLTNKLDCADHFRDVTKIVNTGSGKKSIKDVALSRYACYLVVQNGDPKKPAIAGGQAYFAHQTRLQELSQEAASLPEDERRLILRQEVTKHNKSLSAAAKGAGVATTLDYAVFQDHGYKGLYGGLTAKDIAQRKQLTKSQRILDHMGSTELAANLFRATQTEEKIKRDNVKGKDRANQVHFEVGRKVRQTIEELGGTMPEMLPTPEKSIQQLEREHKRKKALPEVVKDKPAGLPGESLDDIPVSEFEVASKTVFLDYIDCPSCSEPELGIGAENCVCQSCGEEWDSGALAAELSVFGTNVCPHCETETVAQFRGGYLCVACAVNIKPSDLICSRCAHEVPLEEYDVYDETGMCGWCAFQIENDD